METKMKKQGILTKIESAKGAIAAAETDLEKALGDLRRSPRAEKTTVSEVIESAFQKLRASRLDLADLEEILTKEKDA